MGVAINSPKNVIFMHHKIEEAYDRQEWCLLVQPDGNMQVTYLPRPSNLCTTTVMVLGYLLA